MRWPKQKLITNKECLGLQGQVRWPFGPPHLTLKPSQQNTKNKTKENTKKNQKYKKKTKNGCQSKLKKKYIYIYVFFYWCIFWWGSKSSLFWQLDQKSVHPKNILEIWGFSKAFIRKADMRHETAIFGQKTKSRNSSYHFLPFFSFNKEHKIVLKPLFYSALANHRRYLSNFKLKTETFGKNLFLHLFLERKAIFRKLADAWAPKTDNDNWAK